MLGKADTPGDSQPLDFKPNNFRQYFRVRDSLRAHRMTKLQVYAALEGTSTSASHACACSLQVLLLLLLLVPVLSSNEATRATEGIDATETALLNDVLTATLRTKQPCKMQTCTPVPLST